MVDLTEKRFGKLVVIELVEERKYSHSKWLCKCDCGNYHIAQHSNLVSGHVQSCGCMRTIGKVTHGGRGTRLYRIWRNMRTRCQNPKAINYKYYGDRGISVCDGWDGDFASFQRWALENGYRDNLTLDRIDVNGNYEPSNCRWATYKQQANNRRNSGMVVI